jgi:hypothetical protein
MSSRWHIAQEGGRDVWQHCNEAVHHLQHEQRIGKNASNGYRSTV